MTYDPSFHPSNPQQLFRTGSDWTPREYWTEPPKIIPPAPPFNKYVPAPDTIAFGEGPRDTSRYQALQGAYPQPLTVPAPPKPLGSFPQAQAYAPWTLRDYSSNQDRFSILATPLLPPISGSSLGFDRMQPWSPWTARDYAANQDSFSALFGARVASPWIPAPDVFGFGELPRDMTALTLVLRNLQYQGATAVAPKPFVQVVPLPEAVRDMTAVLLVLRTNLPSLGTIPLVPFSETFSTFEYDPLDMTPYLVAGTEYEIPPPRTPQIAPAPIPYIEPPGWTLRDYQALQDNFSALRAVTRILPAGLRPQFTLEALIRDIPRATLLVQNFIIPPPPPRIPPVPATYLEWRDWTLREYPQLNDLFSALLAAQPLPAGFRVMAVTAGLYGGYFYQPGDVFDIVTALDFSDSSKNYQTLGAEYAAGWMKRVNSSTPLSQAAVGQQFFVIPDPNRRFVM